MAKNNNRIKTKKPIHDDELLYDINSFDEQTLLAIVSRVKTIQESWKNALAEKHTTIGNCIRAANAKIGGYELADDSQNEHEDAEIPIALTVVRAAKARLSNSLFSNDNWYQAEPNNYESTQTADKVESYNKQNLKKIEFEKTFGKNLQGVLTTAWGITKVCWKVEKGLARSESSEPVVDKNTEEIIKWNKITEVKPVDVYNNVWVDLIDPLRFWFDPTFSDLKFSNVIEESFIDYDTLINASANGKPLYQIVEEYDEELQGRDIRDEDTNTNTTTLSSDCNIDLYSLETQNNIKLWTYYGNLNFINSDGDKIKLRNYKIVIADEKHCIHVEPYMSIEGRKHPYVLFECYPDPRGPAYTQGMLESCLPMQQSINDYMRTTMSIAQSRLGLRLLYVAGSMDEATVNGIAQGGNFVQPLPVEMKGKIQDYIMNFPFDRDVTLPIQLVQMLEQQIEKTTGVTSVAMGQLDSADRTASENLIRENALDIRLTDILISIEQPMIELLTIIHEYTRMYSEDYMRYKTKQGFEEITRNEILQTELNFTIKSIKTAVDQQRQIEKYMKAMGLLIQAQQNPILVPVVKLLLREMDLPDIADSVPDIPMIPAQMAMQMMQQLADKLALDPEVNQAMYSPQVMAQPELRKVVTDEVLRETLQGDNGQQ